ncbi:MAG: sulfurtransferase TusA family protein [Alphaproteobacteria bacterium]
MLDVKGLTCPMPILRAKKMLNSLSPGEELEVLATDPGSVKDFDAFCNVTGHLLVTSDEADGVYRFIIQKAA